MLCMQLKFHRGLSTNNLRVLRAYGQRMEYMMMVVAVVESAGFGREIYRLDKIIGESRKTREKTRYEMYLDNSCGDM